MNATTATAEPRAADCGCIVSGRTTVAVCDYGRDIQRELLAVAKGGERWQYDMIRKQLADHVDPIVRLSCAETAKLVRAALKESFPSVKFSVKSKTYAGGASIDISWTDGPTSKSVDAVAGQFSGATFDGMIDLKSYREPVRIDGRRVRFASDFVFSHRDFTPAFVQRVADEQARRFSVPTIVVRETSGGAADFSAAWQVTLPNSHQNLQDLIWQALSDQPA